MHHGISAWEALFLNHAKTPRREECRQGPHLGGAAWGENRALKNSLCGDPGTRSSVAAHGIGRCRNRLGGESRADTRRRGVVSKNSASLRLCGRINLMHRETFPGGCPWDRPPWELAGGGNRLRRRGGTSKNSASLRLSGRIILMHRETPSRRVSRRNSLDLQPCESRLAASQHALVTDGHEQRLEHPRGCLPRVLVSLCKPFPAS